MIRCISLKAVTDTLLHLRVGNLEASNAIPQHAEAKA